MTDVPEPPVPRGTPPPPYPPPPPPVYVQAPAYVPPPTSGQATAAMALGISGLASLTVCWILSAVPSLVLGILAIVYGQLARSEIRENPALRGSSQAIAGFVMGIVTTALAGLTAVFLCFALLTGA